MEAKEYSNGEITVIWQAEKCIHSGICVKMLPKVYTPREKPWVHPFEADAAALKNQIEHCPSGALSYRMDQKEEHGD